MWDVNYEELAPKNWQRRGQGIMAASTSIVKRKSGHEGLVLTWYFCLARHIRSSLRASSAALAWGRSCGHAKPCGRLAQTGHLVRVPHLALLKDAHGLVDHCCAVGRLLIQHLHIGAAWVRLHWQRMVSAAVILFRQNAPLNLTTSHCQQDHTEIKNLRTQ